MRKIALFTLILAGCGGGGFNDDQVIIDRPEPSRSSVVCHSTGNVTTCTQTPSGTNPHSPPPAASR